jgi:outer membrane lipoprotein
MIKKHSLSFFLLLMMQVTVGCSLLRSSPFDQSLEGQVPAGVVFSQVVQDPSVHRGQIIKVGGVVLSAKRFADRTEIMVLQIPLDDDAVPEWDRTESQGRFIATQPTFLDPATLPKGTRLTVIGEITGQAAVQVDEEERVYPVLTIKALKVWPVMPWSVYGYRPYWGAYPYYGSYWGPGRYWGSPWGFPRSSLGGRRGFGGHRNRR